jgi:acetyl-CoA acetyltransferase
MTGDMFVYDAVWTPFRRYGGALAGTRSDDLATLVVRSFLGRAPGLDPSQVDAHGGAIAIAHPLGASGTRTLGRFARSLVASRPRWGVAAICIGVGQGLAMVLENVTS